MKRVCVGLITMTLLLGTLAPSLASGPDDGVWVVQFTDPSAGSFSQFALVHQSDSFVPLLGGNVAIALLDPEFTIWTFALGTRMGTTVQGQTFDFDFSLMGPFSITFTGPTTFSGTYHLFGVTFAVSGSKL